MRTYNFIYAILLPLIFIRGLYKSLKFGEKLSRNFERLSIFNGRKGSKSIILVHAVSVGEVLETGKFKFDHRYANKLFEWMYYSRTGDELAKPPKKQWWKF